MIEGVQAIRAARAHPYRRMRVWDAAGGGELDFDADAFARKHLGHIVEHSLLVDRLWAACGREAGIKAVQHRQQINGHPDLAQIVRDTVILEFAPTLTCIVLAGVVGSKIASELGNMRVSEQIDALEIMGINTKSYLILPKIIASMLVIPCLITLSVALGIWGGRLAGHW